MAKKAAATKVFSVEDKLRALCQLQLIDSQIDNLRTTRGELPIEVQDLEDIVQGLETRMNKINEDIAEREEFISGRKIAIDESKALVKKYTKQLDSIKNNREYDSLNKEIEFQNLEIELAEKKIRDAQAKIELHYESKTATQEIINERNEILEVKRKELDTIIASTEKEEKSLLKKSGEAEKVVDERLLTTYKRIRAAAKNGLAVVAVQRDACGGCYSKIPPQKQIDIKSHKKVIFGEHCGRILVDESMFIELEKN
tara:strand:+ start:1162 stop:1929 length:768 start_codon:yes stop_codon:yes gene_type:complete